MLDINPHNLELGTSDPQCIKSKHLTIKTLHVYILKNF